MIMDTERGPVPVPAAAYEGLDAVRRSGLVNMLGVRDVVRVARDLACEEAAEWILENRSLYARGVFCGVEASK